MLPLRVEAEPFVPAAVPENVPMILLSLNRKHVFDCIDRKIYVDVL